MAFTVNKKAFCVLEFAKTESIVTVQRRFRIMYHTEPPTTRTACSFRSAQAATLLEFVYHSRIVLSVGGSVWYMIRNRCTVTISFGKFQDTDRFLIHCERHFSSRLPPSGGTWKCAKAPSTKKNLDWFSTYWYAPFCRVCLGCCAVELGNPGGTYE